MKNTLLKKGLMALSLLVATIIIFAAGVYSGWFLSDYDVLCQRVYSAHKLLKPFKSEQGIVLPEGTIIYLRDCKPNTDARLEFFIDNWNGEYIEKLDKHRIPTYYLDIDPVDTKSN